MSAGKTTTVVVAGALGALLLPVVMVAGVLGGGEASPNPGAGGSCELADVGATLSDGSTVTDEMVANATVIIDVGRTLSVPDEGLVIALTAALVESGLRNLDHGMGSSLGLFQQLDAWAPAADRMNPPVAAAMFFQGGQAGQPGLLDIEGWQDMFPGDAAQAVQRSGFPLAYSQRVDDAQRIFSAVSGTAAECQSPSELAAVITVGGGEITVAAAIAPSLQALLDDAGAAGIVLGGSGWRSQQRQIELRQTNGCPDIWTAPASSCAVPTAIPGSSLHEVGLAVDFTCNNGGTVRRGDACDVWLKANADAYGLYNLPSEPWHYSTTGG